jgi:hypothetical protein
MAEGHHFVAWSCHPPTLEARPEMGDERMSLDAVPRCDHERETWREVPLVVCCPTRKAEFPRVADVSSGRGPPEWERSAVFRSQLDPGVVERCQTSPAIYLIVILAGPSELAPPEVCVSFP